MRKDVRLIRSLVTDRAWGWQRRVARLLDVSDSTVSDILNGHREMSAAMRARVEEILEQRRVEAGT